ncbi:MAG: MqnA/MqnD/SBP family protein, partial [FCB group bacterium]|nr:MqnA/MqnD/SBP family protein [FCB group bacterium]
DEFSSGQCDAALLPVLGVLRKTRARIVPGMGVCTSGLATSERLLCRVPPPEIKTLSVRPGDVLSADLAVILLAELYSAHAEVVTDRSGADAFVLSGDAGLDPGEETGQSLDLGQLWDNLTGLPLIMAVWALGDTASTAILRTVLTQSFQSGLENLDQIAEEGAAGRGIDGGSATHYLHALHYRAGAAEMDSMRTLVTLARKHGRCPADTPLMFC